MLLLFGAMLILFVDRKPTLKVGAKLSEPLTNFIAKNSVKNHADWPGEHNEQEHDDLYHKHGL